MAGYDDTKIIEQVRDMLLGDPSMSRRSAIIAAAGERNLRRIELKMSRIEADAPFALDAERRAVVAAEHAARYPLTLRTGYIESVFLASHPRDEYGNGACSVGFLGDHLSATVAATREAAATGLDLDFHSMPGILTGLSALGIVDLGEGKAWPHPGGPCHRRLSEALVSAWRTANLGGHLDDDALLAEAAEFEDARFERAGFADVASRFPPGFALAMSPVTKALGRKRLDDHDAESMSAWLRREPGAIDLALALGPLSGVLLPSHNQQRFDAGETSSENLWAMLRTNCIDTETGATPDDVSWCLEHFGAAIDAPILTDDAVHDLIAERAWIDSLGPLDADDRAAIVSILSSTDADAFGRRDRDRLFGSLRTLIPTKGTPSALLKALELTAAERDSSPEKVLKTLCIDLPALHNSLHRHMMSEVRRVLPGLAKLDRGSDEAMDRRLLDRAIGKVDFENANLSMILCNRDMAGVVRLVMEWVAAGRPGYALAREPHFEDAWVAGGDARTADQRNALLDLVLGPDSAKARTLFELLSDSDFLSRNKSATSGGHATVGMPLPPHADDASDPRHRSDHGTAGVPGLTMPRSWWRKPARIAAMLIGKRAA